jgi:hypothetical protein
VVDEDLGLVLQTAKGGAVYDPVAVALEGRTVVSELLVVFPAAGLGAFAGITGQIGAFAGFGHGFTP